MKFGSVPIDNAAGAILAHSVRLTKGRLRKGVVLAADHIDTLRRDGIREVVTAQLEEGDVHEDAAAKALAAALVPDPVAAGITLNAVGTGRVNLLSTAPGVAQIDVNALHAVNAVDPMITVATVPPWQQMDASGMLATVKIISYGVDSGALDRACAAARGAIRMRGVTVRRVHLIQTVVPGDDGASGHKAIDARLLRLGLEPQPKTVVPHETAPLAQAIAECDAQIVLILTASATSDTHDTAPEALRAAGGEVTRFGMPVDPGNLLFLGTRGAQTVIGLPGCARSPALNGADWVLARVACGVPVTSADIAGMGVGGLLKEIPSRPQPRRGKAPE